MQRERRLNSFELLLFFIEVLQTKWGEKYLEIFFFPFYHK